MLRELTPADWGTVVVVFDPGRRGGGEGRALMWRRGGCAAARSAGAEANGGGAGTPPTSSAALPDVLPEELAAALFRTVGLPQSAELPAPGFCRFSPPPARVPSFGSRDVDG